MRECEAQGGEGLWNSWPSGGALLSLCSAAARPAPPGTRQQRLLGNFGGVGRRGLDGGVGRSVGRPAGRSVGWWSGNVDLLAEHVGVGK